MESDTPGTASLSSDAASADAVVAAAVTESDTYERSVRGVDIQSVRTGQGRGPTSVASEVGVDYFVTSVTTGFPMANSTTVGDGLVVAVAIRHAPPGARWSGLDIEPGVILYGPGADHTATNPEGMSFELVAIEIDDLESYANKMQVDLATPVAGEVGMLAPSPSAARLHKTLATHVEMAPERGTTTIGGSRVLASLTSALAEPSQEDRPSRHSAVQNRSIARVCIEHLEDIGYVPSIPELCLAVGVSERSLHRAFVGAFGLPPSVYLRQWGLNAARELLLQGEEHPYRDVSRTAFDLGFKHLGRFASYYRQQYGESPSQTLRRRA